MSKLFWATFSLAAAGAGSLGFCWGHGLFSKETKDTGAPPSPIPPDADLSKQPAPPESLKGNIHK